MTTTQTDPTKEKIAVGAFLSAVHDQGLDGARVREAMLDVLGLSATLQARDGVEPVKPMVDPIYYMLDNHTFKKLSEHVPTAIAEIETAFNEGYTSGMLCSKRAGFKQIHATGDKSRMSFLKDCEEYLYSIAAPQPAQPSDMGIPISQPEQGERVDLYSLDSDTEGIRARVVHAVLGALAFGARNENKPPTDHWLSELWEAARAERERKKFYRQDAMDLRDELNSLRELQPARPVALPMTDDQINLMVHSQHFDPSYKLKASDMVCLNWYKLGLRDGERAHGIGGGR